MREGDPVEFYSKVNADIILKEAPTGYIFLVEPKIQKTDKAASLKLKVFTRREKCSRQIYS